MNFFSISLIFSFFLSPVFAQDKNIILDPVIHERLNYYNIKPLTAPIQDPNRAKIFLGKKLFNDPILSGNKRMSCSTCHSPGLGTSDNLPMSQSENQKEILRRNAPALFNLGLQKKPFMFWDGRVHFDLNEKVFTTPEIGLNGKIPKASFITKYLSSALSAQALFPLVSHNEMMGEKGENEIADAKNNLEAWEKIINRLKNNDQYKKLFQSAYPEIALRNINIGLVAEAIGSFEKEEFQSLGSPFQRYLRGDKAAMTNSAKRGLVVFLGSGKCINCHQGSELGNTSLFASVAVPQWGAMPASQDYGRAEVTHDSAENFFFKVPSLLNIRLTAPYMHNGAFQTLKEVVNHYDWLSHSLKNFEVSSQRRHSMPVEVELLNSPLVLDEIWLSSQISKNPKISNKILLTPLEKNYLLIFLSEALTDPKWINKKE